MNYQTIFVVGANGRVGSQVVKKLVDNGHDVIAGTREVNKIPNNKHIQTIEFNFVKEEINDLAQKMKNADAVIFAAGSHGKDVLRIDAFGAVKVILAAQLVNITRFVMLSSAFALEPNHWHDPGFLRSDDNGEGDLTDFNIAKFFADNYLIKNTRLIYTILQPGFLTDDPATGKITTHVDITGVNNINPIGDVAETLVSIIDMPNTVNKVIKMITGDTPIAKALACL